MLDRLPNGSNVTAEGLVRIYDVEDWREYKLNRRHLHPSAEFHNKLTSLFLQAAFTATKDLITWQSLGTNNTTPTLDDPGCTRELARKIIPADGKGETDTQLIYATFFGVNSAPSAGSVIVSDPGNGPVQFKLASVETAGAPSYTVIFPGLRIGDRIRVQTTSGYEYTQITSINRATAVVTFLPALAGAYAVGNTVDQVITEASILVIDPTLPTSLDVQTVTATSARTPSGAKSLVTVTVADTTRFETGDLVRLLMEDTGTMWAGFPIYETGLVQPGKTGTTLPVLLDAPDRSPTLLPKTTAGYIQRGPAANHANNLNYVKPGGRSTVVETIISFNQT